MYTTSERSGNLTSAGVPAASSWPHPAVCVHRFVFDRPDELELVRLRC